jgi:hypothetical protein
MLTLAVVYASADLAAAEEISNYLARNCAVEIEQIEIAGRDLISAMGRALGSDAVVVILSQDAVPARMAREEWEPVFVEAREEHGTHVAFVPLRDCVFPKVLLRSNVFPPVPDAREAARQLKRWLFELRPPALRGFFVRPGLAAAPGRAFDLERMYEEFGDRPGCGVVMDAAAARAFANRATADFESVFWVDCRGCTLAEAAGELATQVAVQAVGNVSSNMETLRSVCGARRCLIVLEGADEELAESFSDFGLTSVMAIRPVEPLPPVEPAAAERTRHRLAVWVNSPGEAPGAGEIRRTLVWLLEDPARRDEARDFARAAIAFYKFHDRFAEAFEILGLICTAGTDREWLQEQSWILESWGVAVKRSRAAEIAERSEQLALF